MADRSAPQTAPPTAQPSAESATEQSTTQQPIGANGTSSNGAAQKRPVLPPMPDPKPAASKPSRGARKAGASRKQSTTPEPTAEAQPANGVRAAAPTPPVAAPPVAAPPVAAPPVAAPATRAARPAPVAPAAPAPTQPVRKPVLPPAPGQGDTAPVPVTRSVSAPAPAPARPTVAPTPVTKAPKPPKPARPAKERPVAVTRRPSRRARLRLTRIDPWSVMKTAFLLSVAVGIVTVVAVMTVWSVLGAAGLWDSINETVQSVLGSSSNTTFDVKDYLGTSRILGFTTLVAIADVVLMTAIATLAAFLYNMAAALLGGIEVTLTEDGD